MKVLELLSELRGRKVPASMDFEAKSMKSQMRSADKSGARYVCIIGEDELKNKSVTIKDMKSGEQSKLAEDKILEFLRK